MFPGADHPLGFLDPTMDPTDALAVAIATNKAMNATNGVDELIRQLTTSNKELQVINDSLAQQLVVMENCITDMETKIIANAAKVCELEKQITEMTRSFASAVTTFHQQPHQFQMIQCVFEQQQQIHVRLQQTQEYQQLHHHQLKLQLQQIQHYQQSNHLHVQQQLQKLQEFRVQAV